MSEVSQETMMFKREPEKLNVAETIKEVYAALEKKGYNPVEMCIRDSCIIGNAICQILKLLLSR